MPQVNVMIAGKAYRMACGEGEEAHLEGLARFYDEKIGEMRQAFGEIGDKTPATFCGAVYFLMKFLTETYAGKTVIFMTPAHCNYSNVDDLYPSPRAIKLPDAKPLLAYVEAIEETAKQFSIPVLNLYRDLGIDTHDRELQAKYTSDGIHFNDAGHGVLAEKLKEFIEAL